VDKNTQRPRRRARLEVDTVERLKFQVERRPLSWWDEQR
jgi:hypothetical protein